MQGLSFLYRNEIAARLEVYSFIWAMAILLLLGTPKNLIFISALLFILMISIEALNTAIEVIIDHISPEISETAKNAKDLGSSAVFGLIIVNLAFFTYAIIQTDDIFVRLSSSNVLIALSLFLMFFAVYTFLRLRPTPKNQFGIIPILAFLLVGSGVFLVSNYFTGKGFDESVVYHLKTGFEGAGVSEYSDIITFAICYLILTALLLFFMFDLLGNKNRKVSKAISGLANENFLYSSRNRKKLDVVETKKSPIYLHIIGYLALGISIIINPFTSNVMNLLPLPKGNYGNAIAHNFYEPSSILSGGNQKNIVFIYLEGLERTYMDENIFPDLTPNLKRIEAESLSYTNIRHVRGTGFTIAGIVASQCGVPIYTLGNGNSMDKYDQFMPNANCVGDILKSNNYHLEYMGGAELKFAGKGSFLNSHGFDTIKGRTYFQKFITDENAFHAWGLHDEYLMEYVVARYKELRDSNQPFGLFALTVDTHHPRGHPSARCEDPVYQDGSNSLLNAVKCTDQLIGQVVNEIKSLDKSGDTIIVIASDHLAMRNIATDSLQEGERRNLFLVVNTQENGLVERPASSLDIAPTLLDLLGFGNHSIGFGRSLTSDNKTLIESFPKEYNKILKSSENTLAAKLWAFPEFKDVAVIDIENEKIQFGDRSMNIPVMIELTENDLGIKRFSFSHPNPRRNKGFIASKIAEEKPHIWIDKCDMIGTHFEWELEDDMTAESNESITTETTDNVKSDLEPWCISYGLPENPTIKVLEDTDLIARWDITKALESEM